MCSDQCPKTLNLSYQKQHSNYFQIFHHEGAPLWPKVNRSRKKVETFFQKISNQGEKFYKKMGDKSCFITSGAFGHGLIIHGSGGLELVDKEGTKYMGLKRLLRRPGQEGEEGGPEKETA